MINTRQTPVYVYDENKLVNNIRSINKKFKKHYPNFKIAYSYKTNYATVICKIANELNCYAEVVSPMEFEHAINCGVKYENIIYNGVAKDMRLAKILIENGGKLHVDNIDELLYITDNFNQSKETQIGVRLNFDIGNNEISRFGIDVLGEDFVLLKKILSENRNLKIAGIHCHISHARDLTSWQKRIEKMIYYSQMLNVEYIDFGSNLYSEMESSLANQYSSHVPSFDDYAELIAGSMKKQFFSSKNCPMLIIEPGTPVVANTIGVLSKVKNIKQIRGQTFITMDCSKFNLGAISEVKNVPIEVFEKSNCINVENAIFVGSTCIEHDILHTGYSGPIGIGSYVLFKNCGAYSVVNQPHFINPAIGMLNVSKNNRRVMYQANYNDVFGRFV